MNKYLLLTAAAVLATSTPALAGQTSKGSGSTTFYLTTGDGGHYCNYFQIHWYNKNYYTMVDNTTKCYYSGHAGTGLGISGRTRGIGKHVLISDNASIYGGCAVSWDFPLPLSDKNIATEYTNCFAPRVHQFKLSRSAGRTISKSTASDILAVIKERGSAAKKAE
ncbi:MAG TPA: hypothetical protein VHU23_06735 [Rhizomicrobium sp.]|jgi:hypothetical protein|nr:hypothetical protein [Rhizomicrobium sp.]